MVRVPEWAAKPLVEQNIYNSFTVKLTFELLCLIVKSVPSFVLATLKELSINWLSGLKPFQPPLATISTS